MLQNLSAQTFRPYGQVLPGSRRPSHYANYHTISLTPEQSVFYKTTASTWLGPAQGMTALSVSLDDHTYGDFLLDRGVQLPAGVWFSLTPVENTSAVEMAGFSLPRCLGTQVQDSSYRISPGMQVQSLYTFFLEEKEPGFLFPGEAHPMGELMYVDKGRVHSVAEGQDLVVEEGELVVYAPNQWHMQYADPGEAPRLVSAVFSTASSLPPLCNRKIQPGQEAAGLLRRMLWEQENPDEYAQDMLLSLLTTLLLLLLRQTKQTQGTAQSAVTLNRENMLIRRVQQYVSDHVQEKLSVPTVAKGCQLSPSYMTALFQKHLHISPAEYIRRIKLQYSKQLIREGNMNITQIAKALEYSTIHHFSRQFKDKFGITPSEYAKSLKETTRRD